MTYTLLICTYCLSNTCMHTHAQALGDYRQTFVMKLPSLRVLDKQPVTVEEKVYRVTLPV